MTATARVLELRPRKNERNARVRRVSGNAWLLNRTALFRQACKYASAAKAFRTALGVTQAEVARSYRMNVSAVTHWESGAYFGWDDASLAEYTRRVSRIARR